VILADSFSLNSSDNAIHEVAVTTGELNSDTTDAESYEGAVVTISNATLTVVNSYDVTFDDGSGPCLVDDDFIAADFYVNRDDKYLYAFGDTIWPGEEVNNIRGLFTYSFGSFKISVRNQNDWGEAVGINPDFNAVPLSYQLKQNYPNPFNPETKIYFEIPKSHDVAIVIYNVLGQKVRTLVKENFQAGQHIVNWNGQNDYGSAVSTGVYFYRIKAGDFIDSKKMVLVR